MKEVEIEIVTIGDEILGGFIENTNTSYLSKELTKRGYKVNRHLSLPDDRKALQEGLREALNRSTLVITTGGLGPTVDDLTREIAATLFASDFRFDEAIARDLKRRFGNVFVSLQDQATVPTKAHVIPNEVGTAPALIFDKRLILLPGVPNEMRTFFKQNIVPFLEENYPISRTEAQKELHFCFLSESAIDLQLRDLVKKYPDVAVGIYPSPGTATVRLKAINSSALASFAEDLKSAFATHLIPSPQLEAVLLEVFRERKLTLALAESCTGGMMAEKITSQPGASSYFLGSLVVYANGCKQKWLGVSESSLKEKGAVSKEVVTEMLEGLFQATDADYGVAVSGIAGPTGGTPEKPVGTVWAALGKRGEVPDVWTFCMQLNREAILLLTTNRLFAALYRKIVFGIPGGS